MDELEKKKRAKVALSEDEKVRKNYHRRLPVGVSQKRGERLKPLLVKLIEENVTIMQLADMCGISRQGMNSRLAKDDCKLSDMEEMAAKLGYKFTWRLEKKSK